MQIVSEQFKESIRNPKKIRNRGYIKAFVGIINQVAQNNVKVDENKSKLTYFSDKSSPFNGDKATQIYATGEKDFSHVDGSMYFLPRENTLKLYNNGIVSKELLGNVYITFGKESGLDIKGLTINFGEYYPTEFLIEYDEGVKTYKNDKSEWQTEDVFLNVSFFNIRPISMINKQGRLRILEFYTGVVKNFSGNDVIKCNLKEYISPISETISSQDLTLEVDNQDLYFDMDDEKSAISFMETGQELKVYDGYDIDGKGKIEWLEPHTCYLSKWKATDYTIEFQAVDRFALLNEKYYKGLYRERGISLYDLAKDVFHDAGISEEDYFIDPYLKKEIVYNPLPPVTHKEALQIICNAGRCNFFQGRNAKIYIKSDFVPAKSISTNDITEFSSIEKVLSIKEKYAYAMGSKDFSKVDGSVYFLPKKEPYLLIGYVSNSVSDSEGNFKSNPIITINLESAFTCYGMQINFRNTKPSKFIIRTYYQETLVIEKTIENPNLNFITDTIFYEFEKMEIEFVKGYPNARVVIDNILLGDYTDYHLSNDYFIKQPERTKNARIKEIAVNQLVLSKDDTEKELLSENLVLKQNQGEYIAYFNEPCYGYKAFIVDNENIACTITEYSDYYAKISFQGISGEIAANLKIVGHEYIQTTKKYIEKHSNYGESIEWTNPLISTSEQAKKLEEWLATFYLGSVDYNMTWWGDPTVDAGDLFYFQTPKGNEVMIKNYENSLTFNGGWEGSMKARRVILE